MSWGAGGGWGVGPPGGGGGGGGGGGFGSFTPQNIMGGLGGLAGIIGSIISSGSIDRTLSGLTDSFNTQLGTEQTQGQKLFGNYFNQVIPELQGTYTTAMGQQGQNLGTAGGYAGGANMAAGGLMANPFLPMELQSAQSLKNYQSFTPQELASLTTGAGAAASSAAGTFAEQSGGVANPALLQKQLVGEAGQTASTTAVQLGSIASQQHLQALEAAAQATSTAGGQYITGMTSAGQIESNLSSEYAGLSESDLTAALNAVDTQAQGLSAGTSLEQNATNSIGNVLQSAYSTAQSSGGGLGGVLGGLTSVLPIFGL